MRISPIGGGGSIPPIIWSPNDEMNIESGEKALAFSADEKKVDEPIKTGDYKVKEGYRSSPAECETCKNRKYQDGSDENVSFKAATHISPEAAPAAVRGHEGEHVSNAYSKAAEAGGKVLQASVAIHTAICPECGKTYVSGGTTTTLISYPKDDESKRDEKSEENFDT